MPDYHNCAGCGRKIGEHCTHCPACIRASLSDAAPKWLRPPSTPELLRPHSFAPRPDSETGELFEP